MKPHEQRVIDEHNDLYEKVEKLTAFMATDVFHSLPLDERGRLTRQQYAMILYRDVLSQRIAHFPQDPT